MEGSKNRAEIRIYVACLAAYNNGILHGRWIDAEQDAWAIYDEVQDILKASPIEGAEEWAIHDYNGFEGVRISEWESFEDVSKMAAFIAEHGALGGQLLAHFDSFEDAEKTMSEGYAGAYESLADFARDITEETSVSIPESVAYYIDYQAMAHDMEISDVFTIQTAFDAVHVFWQH